MKLYATVSSERASKGQGGSKKLEVLLQIDPKQRIQVGRIVMISEDDGYTIKYYPICGASFRATNDKNVITLLDTTHPKSQKAINGGQCANGFPLPCEVCPKDGRGNCTI